MDFCRPQVSRFGGLLAFDVPAVTIVEYLRDYRSHPNASSFVSSDIANWIVERNQAGELVRWTVFIPNPVRDRRVMLGSSSIGLTIRKPSGKSGIGILVDPEHEGVDLPSGPDSFRRGKTPNAVAMRLSRSSANGLLLVYALDPEPIHAEVECLVGLALSLPKTGDETELYIVNGALSNG